MQAAASMARSASGFGIGIALPSGAEPVRDGDESARLLDAVKGAAIDDQVLA